MMKLLSVGAKAVVAAAELVDHSHQHIAAADRFAEIHEI